MMIPYPHIHITRPGPIPAPLHRSRMSPRAEGVLNDSNVGPRAPNFKCGRRREPCQSHRQAALEAIADDFVDQLRDHEVGCV